MSDWQFVLNVKDFYHKYPDELTIQEVAQKMSDVIDALLPTVINKYPDYAYELEEISCQFRDFSEFDDVDADDFDWIMEDLYNWADTSLDGRFGGKKLCWIETF